MLARRGLRDVAALQAVLGGAGNFSAKGVVYSAGGRKEDGARGGGNGLFWRGVVLLEAVV